MKGMNFSKFHKVADNKSHATFRHENGSTLKVAKSGLSEGMRKQVESLPLNLAEGTPIEDQSSDQEVTDKGHAPISININAQPNTPQPQVAAQPQQAPAPVKPPPMPAANQPQVPQAQAPIEQPQQEPVQPEQAAPMGEARAPQSVQPDAAAPQMDANQQPQDNIGHPSMPSPGQSIPDYTHSVYDTLNKEADKAIMDYGNGHITPKTYQDLYAKNPDGSDRGTLSKIGMIFSLMVGGAGAGLTHGQNAGLAMMDKVIDNDLQAQKASKSEQINFLNTANSLLKGRSEIALQGQQGELLGAQKQSADLNNQLLALNIAKTHMLLGAVGHMYGIADKMPLADKAKGVQVANGAAAAVKQKINQDNAKTALAVGANSEKAYNSQTQNLRKMQMLGMDGAGEQVKYREDHQIPGVGTTTIPVDGGTRDRVLKINNFQNLIQEAKDLHKQLSLGAITPAQRTRALQLKNDLVSSYNDVKGLNRFTGNEEKLYDKIVPDLAGHMGALTGSQSAALDRLDSSVKQKKDLEYKQIGLTPFTDNQSQKQPDKQGKQEGNTITRYHNGRPVIYDAKTKKPLRWGD